MKKLFKAVLVIVLCFSFVGCKDKETLEYEEQIEKSKKLGEECDELAEEQRKLNEEAQKKIDEINEW